MDSPSLSGTGCWRWSGRREKISPADVRRITIKTLPMDGSIKSIMLNKVGKSWLCYGLAWRSDLMSHLPPSLHKPRQHPVMASLPRQGGPCSCWLVHVVGLWPHTNLAVKESPVIKWGHQARFRRRIISWVGQMAHFSFWEIPLFFKNGYGWR